MTDKIETDEGNTAPITCQNHIVKRDIFRFNGEKPTAINLEHVTNMQVEGKRIIFTFYTNAIYVDLEDEKAALNCFEQLLNIWVSSTEFSQKGLNNVVE